MATYDLSTRQSIYALSSGDTLELLSLGEVSRGTQFFIIADGTATISPYLTEQINFNATNLSITEGEYVLISAGPGSTWYVIASTSTSVTGVSSIVAGTNVTIDPSGGTGDVTINASGSGLLLHERTTLTPAEIYTVYANNPIVVPGVTGKLVVPVKFSAITRKVGGDTPYQNGGNFKLAWGTPPDLLDTGLLDGTMLTTVGPPFDVPSFLAGTVGYPSGSQILISDMSGAPLRLSIENAIEFDTGDFDVTFDVSYILLDP